MEPAQPNQNRKELKIDCEFNFEFTLNELQNRFNEIGEHETYSVFVFDSDSHEKMDKLITKMLELIFNTNSILTRLYFDRCTFSLNSLKLLSEQKWERLEVIEVFDSKINDECIELLSKCNAPELNHLTLQKCQITDIGVSHICNGKWPKFKELWLSRNKITSIGLQTIGSSKFKDLEVIGLSYNNFKDQIKNIRELFDFPKMKEIELNFTGISEEVLCQLDKKKQPLLEELTINGCPMTGKELFNLERNLGWHNLKGLLIGSEVANQEEVRLGLNNICEYNLPNLKEFYLDNCHLESDSLKILSKCLWKSLKAFSLNYNEITDEGLDYLGCSSWPELDEVCLGKGSATGFGVLNFTKLSLKLLKLNEDEKEKVHKIMNEIMRLVFI